MDLSDYRKEIDIIDKEITALFLKRLDLVNKIAEFKALNNIPTLDSKRESEKLEAVKKAVIDNGGSEDEAVIAERLFEKIMELSKERQNEIRQSNSL